jgi:amidohydrolase
MRWPGQMMQETTPCEEAIVSPDFALSPEERTELIETRRDLHRHPELAYEEHRTAGVVAERLRTLGYDPTTGIGETGVVATVEGGEPGPCVLLRADMDALPIQEQTGLDFASTVPDRMHACGHDCHTAVALSTARLVRRPDLAPARGAIKFVFQPAEEGGNGALRMIEQGVLETPPVSAAFGLHVWSQLETGYVDITDGPFMASVDSFRITVRGAGGHGAEPQKTRDPVVAAAHIVTALQQIVARNVDPLESAVVTVASLQAGDAFNIIPDTAVLTGTCRSFAPSVWEALPEQFDRVVRHTALACGCEADITFERINRPTVNDPAMSELVREVAREVVGADRIVSNRTMGGEDFGEFLARVPGCFFFIGAGGPDRPPHHSPHFQVDEAALDLGVELLVRVAERYLETH